MRKTKRPYGSLTSKQLECQLIRDEALLKIEYSYKIRLAMYAAIALLTGYLYENSVDCPFLFLTPLLIIVICYLEDLETIESVFSAGTYLAIFHNDIFKWDSRLGAKWEYMKPEHKDYELDVKSHILTYFFSFIFIYTNFLISSWLKWHNFYILIFELIIFISVICILDKSGILHFSSMIRTGFKNYMKRFFFTKKDDFLSRHIRAWHQVQSNEYQYRREDSTDNNLR